MSTRIKITNAKFAMATEADIKSGLLGFVSCIVNGSLVLDGIAVRQTRGARLTLSFPARRDWLGRQHFPVRPIDDDARRAIEAQIFAALHMEVAP